MEEKTQDKPQEKPQEKPVEIVLLKPLILNLMEAWLAAELITVFGKRAGFT